MTNHYNHIAHARFGLTGNTWRTYASTYASSLAQLKLEKITLYNLINR